MIFIKVFVVLTVCFAIAQATFFGLGSDSSSSSKSKPKIVKIINIDAGSAEGHGSSGGWASNAPAEVVKVIRVPGGSSSSSGGWSSASAQAPARIIKASFLKHLFMIVSIRRKIFRWGERFSYKNSSA